MPCNNRADNPEWYGTPNVSNLIKKNGELEESFLKRVAVETKKLKQNKSFIIVLFFLKIRLSPIICIRSRIWDLICFYIPMQKINIKYLLFYQISSAYYWIVLSDENLPEKIEFDIAIFAHYFLFL